LTVTVEPATVSVPFQTWQMVWPLLKRQRVVQALISNAPARTVT
jgi:hypothetical protein